MKEFSLEFHCYLKNKKIGRLSLGDYRLPEPCNVPIYEFMMLNLNF